ncbi:aquaporin-like protein [Thelonectria olida]|uniref:Aquaporin-like protein n=1 Tax=Thelonectria olida TaxID=1576542 RepID=A0A9P9AJ61_9HYPO|nr:aquaporin-like protein [Thelonectria olida]
MFPGQVAQANTVLGPDTSVARGVFLEMFFTAQLLFVGLMLAAEKSQDTFLAPIGIGLALFVALIPGVFVTGGSLNPARSFGCAVAGTSFPGYQWIYSGSRKFRAVPQPRSSTPTSSISHIKFNRTYLSQF